MLRSYDLCKSFSKQLRDPNTRTASLCTLEFCKLTVADA